MSRARDSASTLISMKRKPSAGLELKVATAQLKTGGTLEPGQFEAIVSVFGNIDSYGDRMVKGAFERTLREKGPPPLYWNHAWEAGPIGETLEARELDEGLWIKGQLWTDITDPLIARIHKGMMSVPPAVREFSFAFRTVSTQWITEDGIEIREILDVDLFEVGPVTVGANPATQLLEAAGLSWGLAELRHGKAPGHIQAAHDALVRAGAACANGDDDEDDGKSGDAPDTLTSQRIADYMSARP